MSDGREKLLTSASGLERALACTASLVLPRTRTEHEAANRGRVIHEFIERASRDGRDAALTWVFREHDEFFHACDSIDLEALPLELAHEVAFAYDCETGTARELGRGGGFDYRDADPPLNKHEIPGRADVVGIDGDCVLIEDYKTGRVKCAPDSVQNRFLALCALRAYGKSRAVVAVRQQRDDETFWRDAVELDAFEVDELAEQLATFHPRHARIVKVVESGRAPNVFEGSHCRYCPAFHSCPAKTALAIQIGNGSAIEQMTEQLTPGNAALVWMQIKAFKEVANRVERHIYAMAKEQPIDLKNGMILGEHERRGNEKLDGRTVFEVVSELHGKEIAEKTIKLSATKKAISDALKGNVPKVAPAQRAIMELVRKRDGTTRTSSVEVMEYERPDE